MSETAADLHQNLTLKLSRCLQCRTEFAESDVACEVCQFERFDLLKQEDELPLHFLVFLKTECAVMDLSQLVRFLKSNSFGLSQYIDPIQLEVQSYEKEWNELDLLQSYKDAVLKLHRSEIFAPKTIGISPSVSTDVMDEIRDLKEMIAVLHQSLFPGLRAAYHEKNKKMEALNLEYHLLEPYLFLKQTVKAKYQSLIMREVMLMLISPNKESELLNLTFPQLQDLLQKKNQYTDELFFKELSQRCYFQFTSEVTSFLSGLIPQPYAQVFEEFLVRHAFQLTIAEPFWVFNKGHALFLEQCAQLLSWKTFMKAGSTLRVARAEVNIPLIAKSLRPFYNKIVELNPWILLALRETGSLPDDLTSQAEALLQSTDKDVRATAHFVFKMEAQLDFKSWILADQHFQSVHWLCSAESRQPLSIVMYRDSYDLNRLDSIDQDFRDIIARISAQEKFSLADDQKTKLTHWLSMDTKENVHESADVTAVKKSIHDSAVQIAFHFFEKLEDIFTLIKEFPFRSYTFNLFWLRPHIHLKAELVQSLKTATNSTVAIESFLSSGISSDTVKKTLLSFSLDKGFVKDLFELSLRRPELMSPTRGFWNKLRDIYEGKTEELIFAEIWQAAMTLIDLKQSSEMIYRWERLEDFLSLRYRLELAWLPELLLQETSWLPGFSSLIQCWDKMSDPKIEKIITTVEYLIARSVNINLLQSSLGAFCKDFPKGRNDEFVQRVEKCLAQIQTAKVTEVTSHMAPVISSETILPPVLKPINTQSLDELQKDILAIMAQFIQVKIQLLMLQTPPTQPEFAAKMVALTEEHTLKLNQLVQHLNQLRATGS